MSHSQHQPPSYASTPTQRNQPFFLPPSTSLDPSHDDGTYDVMDIDTMFQNVENVLEENVVKCKRARIDEWNELIACLKQNELGKYEEKKEKTRLRVALHRSRLDTENPVQLQAATKNSIAYKIGAFNVECAYCPAIHFPEERSKTHKANEFLSCCNYGKLSELENLLEDYPSELMKFFNPKNQYHKDFLNNIRKINTNYSCASLGCMRFRFPGKNISIFKIQGAIYHSYNSVAVPETDMEIPTNGQLYIIDTEQALEHRKSLITGLSLQDPNDKTMEIMRHIETYLRNNYVFAKSYEMMNDIIKEAEETALTEGTAIPEISMLFGIKEGVDMGRYNIPRSNEIWAILWRDSNDDIPAANIVVRSKGQKEIKRLYPLDKLVEPMVYPILYPKSYQGWHCEIKDKKGKKVSLCDFTKYKLHFRSNESQFGLTLYNVNGKKFLPHHYSGKLFQQWLVDQAARIEWDRLNYIKLHQKEICKETYSGVEKFLASKAIEDSVHIRKQIILPSTFTGGPRNMHESFMDAMAIVNEVGRPDLFITFTANPKDDDILKCLEPGQNIQDRPDIVTRVFRLKVIKFLEEIIDGKLFGRVAGYCYSIEFQKRGLPHLHLLLTLAKENKWKNTDDVDKFISAEIPNENEDRELYDLVTALMIHGPCGPDFTDSICWCPKKKKCQKKFPKEFKEKTEVNENGYPLYKRTNNGRFIKKYRNGKAKIMTNQDVVPYNVYLLKRFRSHINVEKVADIKAVKYIYKYIYKGYDETIVRCVASENGTNKELIYDEASNYLDARYLSPTESCWRILKFPLQGKSHAVIRLPVHLEGEHLIYFDEQDDEETVLNKRDKKSKLMAYFDFMKENPELKYRYIDLPKHCVWNSEKGTWNSRKQGFGKTIGRMYPVAPNDGEKYYLRYLLLHTHGNSFDDLKSYGCKKFDTFGQVCLARGLIKDDAEWKHCLTEASVYKFPSVLRNLFSSILLFGNPKYPKKLWNTFKDNLAEDFLRNHSLILSYKMALYKINQHLLQDGKSLANFPTLPQEFEKHEEEERILTEEELQMANDRYQFMNKAQRKIFDFVDNSIDENKQIMLYIDGPGGTGKSYTLTSLFHLVRGRQQKMTNMAFSGIAATLLKQGRTIHNRFKFPLNLNAQTVSGITNNDAKEIIDTDFFVIDEAPMAPRFVLEAIDKKLKQLMNSDAFFGGKNIILSGDFRQTLPIKKFANRTEIVDLTIKKSKLWRNFKVMSLTENIRAVDKEFATQVLAIGDGKIGTEGIIEIPSECILPGNVNMVDAIYGDIFNNNEFAELKNRLIVSAYNEIVDDYNEASIEKMPGDYTVYTSIDEAEPLGNFPITSEILNSFKCPGFPLHELKVKKNCKLICLRNLSIKDGLCNGTILQLIEPKKNMLRCIILGGDKDQNEVYIHRITLITDNEFPVPLKRHQFPVRLAFSATFIKGQGATYQKLGIDWTRPSFAHGQTYTGISRVGAWNRLYVKLDEENKNRKIANIVWPEVLK